MKHLRIPEDIRKLYKRAAYVVYDAIAGDVPEFERYSRRAKTEVIRDANHLETFARDGMNFQPADRDSFLAWMKEHAHDAEFDRDQRLAIREVIG